MNEPELTDELLPPEVRARLEEGKRHEAYAQVLWAYIDRLKDLVPGDCAEQVAKEMVGTYDRVAAGDARLHSRRTYYTFHGLEPWPMPGTELWLPHDGGQDVADVKVTVQSTFLAPDNRVHCVLELPVPAAGSRYVVRPVLSLKQTATGPTFFELAMQNPKFAREFGPAA